MSLDTALRGPSTCSPFYRRNPRTEQIVRMLVGHMSCTWAVSSGMPTDVWQKRCQKSQDIWLISGNQMLLLASLKKIGLFERLHCQVFASLRSLFLISFQGHKRSSVCFPPTDSPRWPSGFTYTHTCTSAHKRTHMYLWQTPLSNSCSCFKK